MILWFIRLHFLPLSHTRACLTSDGTVTQERSLRGATDLATCLPPLATGKEKPPGESLTARMFLVEVAPGDIDPKRLSEGQRDAAAGLYAQATAGYIQWLAPRLDQVRAQMNATHRPR